MIEPHDRGQPTSPSVRVAFVGDDALLRKRMRSVLATERDFSLVAETGGGRLRSSGCGGRART